MKKRFNVLTSAVGLSILTLSLAACSSGSSDASDNKTTNTADSVHKEGFPILDKPITLSVIGPDVGSAKWDTMQVFKDMEKLSNIKLTFQTIPVDSFETKKNLIFASGTLPDIFYAAALTPAEQVTYGSQGTLIPLEKLINDYAPNLKKLLDEHPEVRKSITTPDGHIYALPFIDLGAVWYKSPLYYNGSFLKKLGVSKLPSTPDELYDYLKRVKTEDPNGNGKADEIPLTSTKLKDIRVQMLGYWGIYDEVYYADKEGKVHYTPQEQGYKEYLTFLNRLWKDDLLDHETFSQTDEQKKSKGKSNQVALFNDWLPYFMLGGEPNTENPIMAPLKTDIPESPVAAKSSGISKNGTFAISKTNPAPEATMRWVDYQYGYEGSTLFGQGPENLLWKFKDKATLTKEWLPVPDGGDRENFRGKLTPNYGITTPGVTIPDVSKGLRSNIDDWVEKENKEKILPYAKVPYPNVFLTEAEQSEVTSILSDLNTYVEQMEAKFVTGQEPLSSWDKYSAQLKKMGSEKIVKIYQDAYDRWDASGK
ncbi:ABC transporter substrate-binding protein [Paenibacillus solisilvae]|uniref:ABC transporter substrate-binding protein n=1 Tax=Paenibacillus solisilvae TaxID=2486751 RepID=A0ABW0W2E4_9BACL